MTAQRAGTASLPPHGGQVPKWLAARMTRLGAVITSTIIHHYGRDEMLRRLASGRRLCGFYPLATVGLGAGRSR